MTSKKGTKPVAPAKAGSKGGAKGGAKGSAAGLPRSSPAASVPEGAVPSSGASPRGPGYKFTYTTGPFSIPLKTHSIDWAILNNDTTPQKVRVTVFKCPIGGPKTPEPPGPLEVTIKPGVTTHNANKAAGGFFYEIQVECNSQMIFPYTSCWPGAIADPMPGSVVNSGGFIRSLS